MAPPRRGGGRGKGGGDGNWTWKAAHEGSRVGGRDKGRGRGRGSHYKHDDRCRSVAKSDHVLKHKKAPVPAKHKGRGKGKYKGGKGGGADDFVPVGPIVHEVPEEQLGRHCEVRKAHGEAVMCMAMTAQGIYTGSLDKSLKRWKPEKGADGRFTLQAEITVPLADACTSLLFHGGWFFCGLRNGNIQAFSETSVERILAGHTRQVTTIIVHENVVISGSHDREVRLWQMDPATNIFKCTHTLSDAESMPGQITKLQVLGTNLFVGGFSGIAVVNLSTLAVTKLLPPTKPVVDMLEFQEHVIIAYTDGSLRIFDPDGNLKSETKPLKAGPMISLAGLDSGPRVLCGHSKGAVSTIALPDFNFRAQFQAMSNLKIQSILCAGHDGIFALGGQDGTLQLWQRVGA